VRPILRGEGLAVPLGDIDMVTIPALKRTVLSIGPAVPS